MTFVVVEVVLMGGVRRLRALAVPRALAGELLSLLSISLIAAYLST